MIRTHYSTQITPEMNGSSVTITGWAHEIRDLGGITFLVVRDREGLVQVTLFKKTIDKDVLETVRNLSRESVVAVTGNIKKEAKAPMATNSSRQRLWCSGEQSRLCRWILRARWMPTSIHGLTQGSWTCAVRKTQAVFNCTFCSK